MASFVLAHAHRDDECRVAYLAARTHATQAKDVAIR